jgi:hypothetical protein
LDQRLVQAKDGSCQISVPQVWQDASDVNEKDKLRSLLDYWHATFFAHLAVQLAAN